jgi:hypothetical protein
MSHLEPRLPPCVESALGRFIANFALLEEYLRGIICEIPQTSAPAGEIITSKLRFRDPISCFGALVKEYVADSAIRKETDDLMKEIENVNAFRNQLVHSLWLPDHSRPAFAVRQKLASSKGAGFSPQIEYLKKSGIASRCDEVARLTFRVSQLYHKMIQAHELGDD